MVSLLDQLEISTFELDAGSTHIGVTPELVA